MMLKTRLELLKNHCNDYGFDPCNIEVPQAYPSITIVIPYYNTGWIFQRCLHFLQQAIDYYPGKCEVVIIDDGSDKKPAKRYLNSEEFRLFTLENNQGRTMARNKGAQLARGEIILFLDSDVMLDYSSLSNHASIHARCQKQKQNAIAISFFEFTQKNDNRIRSHKLDKKALELNDFRLGFKYLDTFIGCEEDRKHVGEYIEIVKSTNLLRNWPFRYKAWVLPNMVLGGAFSVKKTELESINYFDERFSGYGFTETSAVTRMISERGNVVVPVMYGGGLHIEDRTVNVPREEKDRIFKIKHDFYFNVFLREEVNV